MPGLPRKQYGRRHEHLLPQSLWQPCYSLPFTHSFPPSPRLAVRTVRVTCSAEWVGHCATAGLGINSPLGSIGNFTFLDSCVKLTVAQADITHYLFYRMLVLMVLPSSNRKSVSKNKKGGVG